MTKKTNNNRVYVPLDREDLTFPKNFIEDLGGVENAKWLLSDIIDRYFHWEYFEPRILEEMGFRTI